MADEVTVTLTRAELEHLQELRRTNPLPGTQGQPMPYVAAERKWGEAPPANPPSVTRVIDSQSWVTKQLNGLQAVGEANYRTGITRPRKSPTAAAIAAQPAYEAAMRDPNVLKRRVSGLQKTTDDIWASRAENIGAGRLVQGVMQRQDKVERAVSSLQGKLTSHLQRIDSMPNVTDSDREQRMVANLRGLRAMKGTI